MTPPGPAPSGREYLGLKSIAGPLLVVAGVSGVGFDESVEITTPEGFKLLGWCWRWAGTRRWWSSSARPWGFP
jgi:hypothetical protein